MIHASRLEQRVLVLAPTGRDGVLACEVLEAAGIAARHFATVEALAAELVLGAGALLLAEESLSPRAQELLSGWLQQQPPWSDLPVVIFTASVAPRSSPKLFDRMVQTLGNVTMLERPTRVPILVTALRAALRARWRQYAARESLVALERQEQALKRADQRKDEFLAMLAHELRNPMAALSMALTLLERSEGDAERTARHRGTAKRQVANLVRLVDDLLDVSRITRGTVELRKARVDFAQTLHQAVSAARPSVEARQHELSFSVGPGPYTLEADPTRLEQVVANLLSNAAKYTPPGGKISVRLERVEAGARGEGKAEAVLTVTDTGRGIPAAMLGTIFDLFFQVDPGLDRSTGGLGLGLTLVRSLVEMHGGSVQARSDGVNRGAELTVRLPLSQGEVRPAPSEQALPRAPTRSARRVVLVEDSDDIRASLRELLEMLGHQVFEASTGQDGVNVILEQLPDLALVDLGLPGISGYEIARQVRATPAGASVMMVALTGYGGPDDKAKAVAAGFDLHLTKPLDVAALPRLLEASRSPRGGPEPAPAPR